MTSGQFTLMHSSLTRLFSEGTMTGASESELLERFLSQRDEAAFEAILRRHGPMVLAICRRILADPNDVDDAFQATFLVLVKKAGSIRDRKVLGTWLHGVARRVAVRARVNARRRRDHERGSSEMTAWQARSSGDPDRDELRAIIDEEVTRLTEKYRTALVLCDLEGQTHEEAAANLRCPVGTVKSRLARAREALRSRLVRRGFAPSAAIVAGWLAPEPASAVTSKMISTTINAAVRLLAGRKLAAGVVSAAVAALVEQTLRGVSMNALKIMGVLTTAGVIVTSAGTFAYQTAAKQAPNAATAPRQKAYGKASLPGLEARKAYDLDGYRKNVMSLLRARTLAVSELEQLVARYLAAVREKEDRARAQDDAVESAKTAYYRLEGEHWLAKLKSGQHPDLLGSSVEPRANEKASNRPGTDERSQAVLASLEVPIPMKFPKPTPLGEVLKYIQQATAEPENAGIAIYVDPIDTGENISEKLMKTPITMDLEGVPLRTTLKLIAEQLEMGYGIKDGMVVMRLPDMRRRNWHDLMVMEESFPESSPLAIEVERSRRGELTPAELDKLDEQLKAIEEVTKRYQSIRLMRMGMPGALRMQRMPASPTAKEAMPQ